MNLAFFVKIIRNYRRGFSRVDVYRLRLTCDEDHKYGGHHPLRFHYDEEGQER